MNEVDAARRRARRALIAIAALFFVPLAVAWVWYAQLRGLPPDESVAQGELVSPPRPLGGFELPRLDADGQLTDETLDGRWAVVHVEGPVCGDECRARLWASRQVHTRLGREGLRVQRVYLLVGADAPADAAFFEREHPGLLVARIDADDPLLGILTVRGDGPGGRTFVVDPLGNLMMRYAPDYGPQQLYDDLKRALRLSRIG
jgi:hypothetical protein